ncbi:RNA polymerase-binding protein RbpA, partial [Streptomyces griseorubiginosus]|uniref:RNA polymerase-binding protein RbpA n=1 Tax=Streptomyces griseorubiginosus TaxID=67304 RepID=UPI003452F011
MSERALRGTRLVVTSYETDRGIDLAPRQAVEYACEKALHALRRAGTTPETVMVVGLGPVGLLTVRLAA